jgi:hypothetical protein
MRIEDGKKYAAAASRATSGATFKCCHGWVGIILKGAAGSPFPPNVVAKRMRKAWETRAEAAADAEAYLKRQQDREAR